MSHQLIAREQQRFSSNDDQNAGITVKRQSRLVSAWGHRSSIMSPARIDDNCSLHFLGDADYVRWSIILAGALIRDENAAEVSSVNDDNRGCERGP